MANSFGKYSNYDKKSAFSSILFGSEKPLLEVELNELQQIISNYRDMIIQILGYGVNFSELGSLKTDHVSLEDDGCFHLLDCIITGKNGIIFYVENEKVKISDSAIEEMNNSGSFEELNKDIYYFKVWEEDATFSSTLTEYGNVNGDEIPNNIMDSRSANETSRRKVLKHELLVGREVPEDTDTEVYIEVGHFNVSNSTFDFDFNNKGNFTEFSESYEYLTVEIGKNLTSLSNRIEKVENQLNGVSFSIEDGILTVTYDDGN